NGGRRQRDRKDKWGPTIMYIGSCLGSPAQWWSPREAAATNFDHIADSPQQKCRTYDSAGHASSRTGKLINLYCDRRDPCEHHSGKPSSRTNQNRSHNRVAEPNGKSTY